MTASDYPRSSGIAISPRTVLRFGPSPVLDPAILRFGSDIVDLDRHEATTAQLPQRYELVVLSSCAIAGDDGHRRAVLHTALQHLARNGHLAIAHLPAQHVLCDGFSADDLRLVATHSAGGECVSLYQRGARTTIHDLVFEARATIERYHPRQLAAMMDSDSAPVVIDTRTHTDRGRFGVIPTSIHVPRTVLEWHLDPANGYLHPSVRSFDQPLVIVCNGGYSSSLAAANLVQIGFTHVADLIGGHSAWCNAGFAVEQPSHSHLDIP